MKKDYVIPEVTSYTDEEFWLNWARHMPMVMAQFLQF
jgi:hypothetical protein